MFRQGLLATAQQLKKQLRRQSIARD